MKKKSFITVIFFVVILFSSSCKQDFAQWRGINRNGIYLETNLLNEWTENGPKEIWAIEGIGTGYASPTVTNDKLLVNGEIDSISHLFAFNLKGELLWKTPNGKEFFGNGFSATYPGARSAPTVFGNLVYTSSGLGRIMCCDVNTGSEKWAVDIINDLGGNEGYFGYAECLAVDDEKVYCFAGGSETNLAALNRRTGKSVWTSKALGDTSSYCSPIFVDLPVGRILVSTSKHNLFTINCSTGELLGSYSLDNVIYDGDHCNSPVYANGYIYYTTADNNGTGTVKLKLSDDGKTITEVWRNKRIKNNFGGFVVLDDKFYTTVRGNWLKALDLETGNVADSLQTAWGSIIYADNKFFTYGRNGEISLITNRQGNLKIKSTFKVEKGTNQHFSHPVLANGTMYIRHGDALMAYKIN